MRSMAAEMLYPLWPRVLLFLRSRGMASKGFSRKVMSHSRFLYHKGEGGSGTCEIESSLPMSYYCVCEKMRFPDPRYL